MADGEEDLREKNRGFGKPGSKSRFTKWERRLGEEDAGMLEEKSEHWSARKSNRGDYDSEEESPVSDAGREGNPAMRLPLRLS